MSFKINDIVVLTLPDNVGQVEGAFWQVRKIRPLEGLAWTTSSDPNNYDIELYSIPKERSWSDYDKFIELVCPEEIALAPEMLVIARAADVPTSAQKFLRRAKHRRTRK